MRLLALFALLLASPAFSQTCSGCGCRGGPGYRGPDGSCVGFASLRRICGDPPEMRCKKEGGVGARPEPCSRCGCKGGPGYRNPATGQCVGRRDLKRICGDPPTSGCLFEGSSKPP